MTQASFTFIPRALTAEYLSAFALQSQRGTIFAPFRDGSGLHGFRSRLLTDGASALNLLESTRQALGDCHDIRAMMAATDHYLPQPLPTPAQGWVLQKCVGPKDDFSTGSFCVERGEGPLSVEADLSDRNRARFAVILHGKKSELAQWITVDRKSGIVHTEQYQIRARFKERLTALSFAGDLATLIYECGQYLAESELGALMVRDKNGIETRVDMVKGRYRISGRAPDLTGDIMLCSALSIFATSDASYREPVVSVEISGEENAEATISLYRPPNRTSRLMPLHPRLTAVWEKLLERIVETS